MKKRSDPLTDAECEELWRSPPRVAGKPVYAFDPNNCCFDLRCATCGGRVWIGDEMHALEIGQEVGIAWYAPRFELPEEKDVMWVLVAGCVSEWGWYVEPKGGW